MRGSSIARSSTLKTNTTTSTRKAAQRLVISSSVLHQPIIKCPAADQLVASAEAPWSLCCISLAGNRVREYGTTSVVLRYLVSTLRTLVASAVARALMHHGRHAIHCCEASKCGGAPRLGLSKACGFCSSYDLWRTSSLRTTSPAISGHKA